MGVACKQFALNKLTESCTPKTHELRQTTRELRKILTSYARNM